MAKKTPDPEPDDAEEAPTQDEVDGKKEPRVYKGTETKLSEVMPGTMVQTMPGTRTVKGAYNDQRLPLFMLVDSIGPYSSKTEYVSYRDPRARFKQLGAEVPKGYMVNVLAGRMKDTLAAELRQFRVDNMGNQLHWPGGFLGTDPELFVVDEAGAIIPAFNFLGSKKKPNRVDRDFAASGEVYWDGFQAEFTTEATNCLMQQTDRIAYGLNTLYGLMLKHNPKARLSIESVLPVPDGLLESSADEHVEFGCAPSINVYGLSGNTAEGRHTPIRMAGGHLHLGIFSAQRDAYGVKKEQIFAKYPACIKALDAILGVGCVSMFENYDSPMRRRYYGLPGEYRTPPHGIEYRTLSNAWLIHPLITNVVFEVARRAVALGWHDMLSVWNAPEAEVVEIIRENDVAGARKVLKRNEDMFKKLMSTYVFASSQDKLFNLFYNGMERHLKHPRDIAANWGLSADMHTMKYRQETWWGRLHDTLPNPV